MSSKRAVWCERLEAWQASGLSAAGFCRSCGLSYAQFVYWQRVLRTAPAVREEALSFVPIVVDADAVTRPGAGSGVIEVVLPNGVRVHLPCGCTVADVVTLVRGLCPC